MRTLANLRLTKNAKVSIFGILAANGISAIGDSLAAVALPWFVYQTTGSAAKMGVVGFFNFLPIVIAAFLGGPLVDRIGFKRSSMLADLLSGLSVASIALLAINDRLSFPLLLGLVFAGSFFDAPGATARESMIPDLAKLTTMPLSQVNGMYQSMQRMALFVGPVVAGLLITQIGAEKVLLLNSISFLISIITIALFVSYRQSQKQTIEGTTASIPSRNLLTGIRYIFADKLLLSLAIVVALLNLFDAPRTSVLFPVLVENRYDGAKYLGFLVSAVGIGALVSTLVFSAIGARFSRRSLFVGAFIVMGLPYWIMALNPPFWVAALSAMTMGLAAGPINPILMTVRQERVPESI